MISWACTLGDLKAALDHWMDHAGLPPETPVVMVARKADGSIPARADPGTVGDEVADVVQMEWVVLRADGQGDNERWFIVGSEADDDESKGLGFNAILLS